MFDVPDDSIVYTAKMIVDLGSQQCAIEQEIKELEEDVKRTKEVIALLKDELLLKERWRKLESDDTGTCRAGDI